MDPEDRQARDQRARAAFVAGAEHAAYRTFGRGLTNFELRGVIEQYPGDPDVATARILAEDRARTPAQDARRPGPLPRWFRPG